MKYLIIVLVVIVALAAGLILTQNLSVDESSSNDQQTASEQGFLQKEYTNPEASFIVELVNKIIEELSK